MRDSSAHIAKVGLSGICTDVPCVGLYVRDGLQVDLWKAISDSGPERAGRSVKDEPTALRHSQLDREIRTAQARVPTESRLRAVAVIVAHTDIATGDLLHEDNAI